MAHEMPFADVDAFQVPLAVLKGDRPIFPKDTPKVSSLGLLFFVHSLQEWRGLVRKCWAQVPKKRPDFADIVRRLRNFAQAILSTFYLSELTRRTLALTPSSKMPIIGSQYFILALQTCRRRAATSKRVRGVILR